MAHAIGEKRVQRDIQAAGVTAVPAVDPDHRSGPKTSARDSLHPDRHHAEQAANPDRNPKADACAQTPVDELLADLNQCGIRLRLADAGKIRVSGPRDALTQEFRERIHWLWWDLKVTLMAQRSNAAASTTSPSPARPLLTAAPTAPPPKLNKPGSTAEVRPDPRTRPNPKAAAAVEKLKEKLDQKARDRRGDGEPQSDSLEATAGGQITGENQQIDPARDPVTGRISPGHNLGTPGPGRPRGSKNAFPRGTRKVMKELVAGRIRAQIKDEDGKDREVPISRILVQLYFDGMQGKVILRQHGKSTTYVSPLIFLKSFLDFMLKDMELRLKKRAARALRKGTGRGIQVVLLNGAGQPANRPSAADIHVGEKSSHRCPDTSDKQ